MKRLHVHVSVDNLNNSIKFYSGMFGTEPTVVKPDYAKWMLEDPRINFAISHRGAAIGLNHLGIQVESDGELGDMRARLTSLQPDVEMEEDVACCYAKSDKYWVTDPSSIPWETFHTLDTIPVFGESTKTSPGTEVFCVPLSATKAKADAPCCKPASSAKQGATCC